MNIGISHIDGKSFFKGILYLDIVNEFLVKFQ